MLNLFYKGTKKTPENMGKSKQNVFTQQNNPYHLKKIIMIYSTF